MNYRRMFKQTLVLTVIVLFVTLLLSYTHSVTQPRIEEQREQEFRNQVGTIFPDVAQMERQPAYKDGEQIGEYHTIYNEYDRSIGYVAEAQSEGYQDPIRVLVGFDTSGRIKGVRIISQQETPGIGDKITQDSFLAQFKDAAKESIALASEGGKIDAITGATISSEATTEAVKKAERIVKAGADL